MTNTEYQEFCKVSVVTYFNLRDAEGGELQLFPQLYRVNEEASALRDSLPQRRRRSPGSLVPRDSRGATPTPASPATAARAPARRDLPSTSRDGSQAAVFPS